MPPRWSFGFWQSKCSYSSWDEVWEIVARRRARSGCLPTWSTWTRPGCASGCTPTWSGTSALPGPAGNLARLREEGIRISLWLQPWIPEESEVFAEAWSTARSRPGRTAVYLYAPTVPGRPPNRCGIVDFTSPTGREWYIQKILG